MTYREERESVLEKKGDFALVKAREFNSNNAVLLSASVTDLNITPQSI